MQRETSVKPSSPITTWSEIQTKYQQYATKSESSRWIFRGQQDACWSLKPSLQRALERFQIALPKMRRYENRLLREFKRHFHRYSKYVPEAGEMLEWLTLMQHHGAPTRLLDWTYSFHVALFFAIEHASNGQTCAVWAVNQDRCWNMIADRLLGSVRRELEQDYPDPAALCWLLNEFREPLLWPRNPFRLNTRLAVQQGTFLIPMDLTRPFQDIFDASVAVESGWWERIDIVCSHTLITQTLTELQRMNITRLSLFPGVDGLAQSLWHVIPLKHFWTYG